ncbi:MAG: M48 family metallopeptidase [Planctomycetes bacterium]|nr:M48 family metallopeptidase [Planctomycetota bacterium]
MNAYGIVILGALLASYALDLAATILNLRALPRELPREMDGVCDPDAYRRTRAYTRATSRLDLFADTWSLLLLLGFWQIGGFEWLDRLVRSWAARWDGGEVSRGLLYIGCLLAARLVLGLPLSIYSTFGIEERFGFNRTTAGTFIADRIKGAALAVLIGAPLLALVILFFERAGPLAWLYGWGLVTLVSLFLHFVFPTWILPLFNKFTPLGDGDLKQAILEYAARVRFPLESVFVVDGSRRSAKANAFFTGFGRRKRLALFDTLIEKHEVEELVAVVAHEVGHARKWHIQLMMAIGVVHSGILFYLLSVFMGHRGLFDAFYLSETSIYAGLVLFGLLYAPIELILSLALQAFSRRCEREADRFAARTIDDPEHLVAALKKLAVGNLSHLTPHPVHVFLHGSHPPLLERIGAIRAERARG